MPLVSKDPLNVEARRRRSWLPRNRWARALAFLVFGVVALEALYVVVANVALAAVAKRFADEEPVGVAFERGYTWLPGRIHLHGVRLRGSANGGWSVALSDADASFAPWRVATAPRRIDSVAADVTSIELGGPKGTTRRSNAAMHLVVSDVTIDGTRVSFRADARVDAATLENGKTVLAKDVHGSIALTVAPVDVARHSLLDKTSGTVSLDGVFASLEPLASFASLGTTQDAGTLHVTGSLQNGLLGPSSEIRAHTAHATLTDARGASADFPRGLDVVVRVAPLAPSELQLAVETPSLVFGSADKSLAPDVFDDFELAVPAGSSDLTLDRLAMRSLVWSARHASVHEGATTLGAIASGDLHFEIGHDAELVADSGVIHATHVVVENPDATDRTPFDGRLAIARLSVSRGDGLSLRGRLVASGDDARPLVEVLVTSPSIRGALGPLARQSFTFEATMDRKNGRLALDELTLRAGRLALRGGYRRAGAKSAGAFILDGGPLPVGIALHDKTESIVLGASSSWLERALPADP